MAFGLSWSQENAPADVPAATESADSTEPQDPAETEWLLQSYERKGYHFISMPEHEAALHSGADRFYREDSENSHDVIGLEFDAVAVVLDRRFWYHSSGQLMGAEGPSEDYLYVQMLYQNLSRAKEKLCVIVQGNEEVFRQLVKVLE